MLIRLQNREWFWKVRAWFNKVIFEVKCFLFGARKIDYGHKVYVFGEIIRVSFKSVIFTILIISLTELFEKKFILQYLYSFKLLIPYITPFITFKNLIAEHPDDIVRLLSVITSISGLLLGLYFTAVSIVASSFAKLPDNVRSLLVKERVGSSYIFLLAVLTALCISVICSILLGFFPGAILITLIIIASIIGIFSFVPLGRRTFHFFNPSIFVDEIFYDLFRNIKFSTAKGFQFLDINFQGHYQKDASRNLRALSELVNTCLAQAHLNKSALSGVLQKTLSFLQSYQLHKAQIPTNSRWYALELQHKTWLLSDSAFITVALESQTGLQPEEKPNKYWLEDNVIDMLNASLSKCAKEENYVVVYDVISYLEKYLEKLGNDMELDKGKEIVDHLLEVVLSITSTLNFGEEFQKQNSIRLGIFEAFLLAYMAYPLGFFKKFIDLKQEDFIQKFESIDWGDKKHIYKGKFCPKMLEHLEKIQNGIEFEKKIEAKQISPQWYIRQLLCMHEVNLYSQSIDVIVSTLEQLTIISEKLLDEKKFVLSAFSSQRGLELSNKTKAHFRNIEVFIQGLSSKVVKEKELSFDEISWKEIRKKIQENFDKLVLVKAKCLLSLSLVERDSNQPDLFGQTYETVCQEAYNSLELNNDGKFKELFHFLFLGALRAYEVLRKELAGRDVEVTISFISEPLIDLLELSGYAKVYSELYDVKQFWEECVLSWDRYFESLKTDEERKRMVELLVQTVEFRSTQFKLLPRDIIRTNWEMRLNNVLREKGFMADIMEMDGRRTPPSSHKSKIIQILAKGHFTHLITTKEIFIITYLLKRPEAADIIYNDKYGLGEELAE